MVGWKSYFSIANILNALLFVFLAAVLLNRAPVFLKMHETQGDQAKLAGVVALDGEALSLPSGKRQVLVFWATWCGPCGVELGRINKMINNGKIAPEAVLAVSIKEEKATVEKVVSEKKYKFKVALDENGDVANLYGISGTPTVFLIDESGKIEWMTMGISPSLEFRLSSFFSGS